MKLVSRFIEKGILVLCGTRYSPGAVWNSVETIAK